MAISDVATAPLDHLGPRMQWLTCLRRIADFAGKSNNSPQTRQMQCDFATIRRARDRLSVFIATLGRSRATYDERLETLLGCHERALYMQDRGSKCVVDGSRLNLPQLPFRSRSRWRG